MNWLGFFEALATGFGILLFVSLWVAIAFSGIESEHRPWIAVVILAVLTIVCAAFVGGLS